MKDIAPFPVFIVLVLLLSGAMGLVITVFG